MCILQSLQFQQREETSYFSNVQHSEVNTKQNKVSQARLMVIARSFLVQKTLVAVSINITADLFGPI